MGRGFFAGTFWGALVGVSAIALATQLTERRELSFPRPQAAELEVPGGTEFDQARPETDPIVPAETTPVDTDRSPEVAELLQEIEREVPSADTAPASPPDTADAPEIPAAPPEGDDTEVTVDGADAAPATDAPVAPVGGEPPEPGPETDSAALSQPVAPEAGDSPTLTTSGGDTAIGQSASALAGASTDAPPTAPAATPVAPVAPDDPARPVAPGGEEEVSGTGLPEPGFSSAPNVTTDRLVRIGDEQGEEEVIDLSDVPAEELPALVRYAATFENPDADPVISVILLHDPGTEPAPERGLDLPVPVTFAVRGSDPDAAATAAAYRAAGREVILIPSLPPGATPADVEVALQANFAKVPEAVALMDAPETGFQSERTAVAQVVAVLEDEGLGLVTFPRGLNTAQQLAERAALPSRLVFRQLDPGGQAGDTLLRTLDRAAFRARQEGVVILVGQAEPRTAAAILEWAAANALGNVRLAPVSAALLAE